MVLNVMVNRSWSPGFLWLTVQTGFYFSKSAVKTGFGYQPGGATMVGMPVTDCVAQYYVGLMFPDLFNDLFLMCFVVDKKTVFELKLGPERNTKHRCCRCGFSRP